MISRSLESRPFMDLCVTHCIILGVLAFVSGNEMNLKAAAEPTGSGRCEASVTRDGPPLLSTLSPGPTGPETWLSGSKKIGGGPEEDAESWTET